MRIFYCFFAFLLCLSCLPAIAQPKNPDKAAAMRPNLDIYVYRRCYMPNEKIQLNFSGFNEHVIRFTAYRLDLGAIVKKSGDLDNFGLKIRALNLTRQHPVASWAFSAGKIYPNQWAQMPVRVPKLPPGAYVIQADGAGVIKRTWLAVTNVALITKQSRQELLVFAANPITGRPLPGISLALDDTQGAQGRGVTDADGMMRVPTEQSLGNLWIYGETAQGPAFSLSGKPLPMTPYTVYTYTDRPIYRPGNLVYYNTIIRRRIPADAPGGFTYEPYADHTATVEIRDATDALITRTTVTTDAFGAAHGTFQLAPAPSLGAWSLNVSIGSDTNYTNFIVQQYHKPTMTATVTIPQAHYLSGTAIPVTLSAQYYYGQPVTGAVVQYAVSCSGGSDTNNFSAKGRTDSQGELHLTIPTQPLPQDGSLSVQATITDLSRSSTSASTSTLLTAGMFQLSLSTDQSVYLPGRRILVLVQAEDYDQKPVIAHVKISMIESEEDRKHHAYLETTTHEVVTAADGKGETVFSSPRPGILQFTAETFDSRQDKITAGTSVQVVNSPEAAFVWPTLSLSANKPAYAPGDTALVTLETSLVHIPYVAAKDGHPAQIAHPDAWALITVEGERLGISQVVHLTHRKTVLRIPVSANDFPSVSVNASIIEDKQIYEQEQPLTVALSSRHLMVSVTSDKPIYHPGQTATYTVTTRDDKGRPVPAQVSLGVVDASIYALAPDQTASMQSAFYSGQTIRVQTDFSFAAQYSGGGYQNISAQSPGAAAGGIRIRKKFADTAYWNPILDTGPNGTATVSFVMPDNVTTWQATAHAITISTAVGSATQSDIVNMPLLVHLVLPAFAVQNDQTVIGAVIQNSTGEPKSVVVHLSATGAVLTGPLVQTVQLDANTQKRLDWPAQINGLLKATFLVSADGGLGAQDADELTLPVKPDGLPMVTASASELTGANAQQKIDLHALPPGANVTLTLSPSLFSSLSDTLESLQSPPSGNAEDTVSALLPDVAVAGLLGAGADQEGAPKLRAQLAADVSLSLQRLYAYQHPDGGWNWWRFDQTDGDMTAYVLSALTTAKEAGFTVDSQRFLRGVQSLTTMAKNETDPQEQADWLLVLTEAGASDPSAQPDALFKNRQKLGLYGEASLCLALALLHTPHDQALQQTLAADLASKAVVEGRLVHWTPTAMDTDWRQDPETLTAHVLRALIPASPQSPLLMGAVNWLMENRDCDAWDSSRASAEAVLALCAFLADQSHIAGLQNALQTDYTAQVLLDGKTLETLPVTPQNVFGASTMVTLSAGQLAGHTALTVTKQGAGVLYLSEMVSSLLPPPQITPQSAGITVTRQYQITVDDPAHAASIASGTVMNVQLSIDAASDSRYVRIEDPLPAGCALDSDSEDDSGFPIAYSDGDVGYTREEQWDDKAVFYFDSLPKGTTELDYSLNVVTPGYYTILPAVAALQDFPEVRGNSGLAHVRIGGQP